jgi:3-phosphoglycerate kinase
MPAAPCRPSSTRSARRWKRRAKPVIAIVGGAKVSTKLDLLENLVARSTRW